MDDYMYMLLSRSLLGSSHPGINGMGIGVMNIICVCVYVCITYIVCLSESESFGNSKVRGETVHYFVDFSFN